MKKYFQLLRLSSHKIYPQTHQSQSYQIIVISVENKILCIIFHMHFLNEVQLFQGFIRNALEIFFALEIFIVQYPGLHPLNTTKSHKWSQDDDV